MPPPGWCSWPLFPGRSGDVAWVIGHLYASEAFFRKAIHPPFWRPTRDRGPDWPLPSVSRDHAWRRRRAGPQGKCRPKCHPRIADDCFRPAEVHPGPRRPVEVVEQIGAPGGWLRRRADRPRASTQLRIQGHNSDSLGWRTWPSAPDERPGDPSFPTGSPASVGHLTDGLGVLHLLRGGGR